VGNTSNARSHGLVPHHKHILLMELFLNAKLRNKLFNCITDGPSA
jgi:hypothetical protein